MASTTEFQPRPLFVKDIYSILKIRQQPIPRSFYEEIDPIEMDVTPSAIQIDQRSMGARPPLGALSLLEEPTPRPPAPEPVPEPTLTPLHIQEECVVTTCAATLYQSPQRGLGAHRPEADLSPKGEPRELKKKKKKDEVSLNTAPEIPEMLQRLLGPEITIPPLPDQNRSLYYRFMDSVFTALDLSYRSLSTREREEVHQKWVQRLDHELFHEHRYQEFQYGKNRKVNKEDLQQTLNDALHTSTAKEREIKIIHCFMQYTTDMLAMNLILHNPIKEKSRVFYYKNRAIHQTPLLILHEKDMVYYPVLRGADMEGIFQWGPPVEKLYKYFGWEAMEAPTPTERKVTEPVVEAEVESEPVAEPEPEAEPEAIPPASGEAQLNKLTVDELMKLCREKGLTVSKVSAKTGLFIKKKKSELIETLLA